MSEAPRQVIIKYAVAIAAVVVVLVLKLVIAQLVGTEQWFLLFTVAIAFSSWYGGFGPGIVAAVLSTIFANLFFAAQFGVFDVATPSNLLQLLLFLAEGLVVVALTGNLRESREQVRKNDLAQEQTLALLETFQVYAPVGLAFLDKNLRYVRINYAMAEIDGLTPAAHIGRSLREVQPQFKPELVEQIQQVLETGKPLLDQELIISKPTMLGMRKQYFLTSYYRIRGADGEPLGVGAVMVDMTEDRRAQEALRESEARFRNMADTAPVMIWVADKSKLRTYLNKVWLDFTGQTLEHELGNGWIEHLHPDDLTAYLDVYSKAFDTRTEFSTEYRLHRKDDEYRWMLSHGVPRFTPEGEFSGYIGISVDITERKLLEIGQDFILNSGAMLATSLDYETTLANVTRLAVPTMADWCAVDILSEDRTQLNRLSVEHVNSEKAKWAYELQQRYPVDLNGESGVAQVLRTGKTHFLPEVTESMIEAAATDAESYQILTELGLTSVITVPLIARGRTLGALTLVSAESKRRYTETDVRMAELLATRAALGVDNARLIHDAHAERERYRVTLTSIGDAVIATDHQGQVNFMNQIAQNLTGWAETDAVGKPLDSVFKIINEQSRQTVENPVIKVLREGRVVGLANHTLLVSKSGDEHPIDDSGAPIPGDDGSVGGVVLVFRDVTERKREEQRQQFLVEASQLLSSSLEYENTLSTVVKLAVPTMADWSAVDMLTPQGTIKRVTVAHVDPDKVQWAYEIQERFPPTLNAPNGVGLVLRTGETEFVADVPALIAPIYDSLSNEMKQVMDKLQAVSVITTPLTAGGVTFGTLTFATAESGRRYNQSDVQVAEALAVRAALAVDNARLYEEARAERERFRVTLSSIGDAVIATDDQGDVTFINQIAQNLTGWTEADALGKPLGSVFNIINEQSREIVENPVERVLREGHVVGLANHTLLVSKSGDEHPIDDSGAPIPAEDGSASGIVLVFRDVTERKQEERRQEFLAEASSVLGSSLDYETILTNLVNFSVPAIADWCAVDLVADDNRIERLAVAHFDPEKAKLAYELSKVNSRTMDTDGNLQRVIRTGKTDFVPVASEEILRPNIASPEAYELVMSLNPKSYMLVPLITRGRAIGAFSLVYTESGRIYTENDVALVEQLASRAALAVDNARLYRKAQESNAPPEPPPNET